MSCHDAREWLSDLLDDALEADTRAQVETHLAGCADCRRELDRLTATVSLLAAVERPQAPLGFVDRVLEAARPTPRHRRFLDRLAGIRLLRFPVEAAAVVLVASLAVYVFQGTPALRRAAQPEIARDHIADSLASTEAPSAAPEPGPDAGREPKRGVAPGLSEFRRVPQAVAPTARSAPPPAALEPSLKQKAPAAREDLVGSARTSARPSSDPGPSAPLPSGHAAPSVPQGAVPAPGTASSQPEQFAPVAGRLQSLRKDNASGDGGGAERPTSQPPPLSAASGQPPELRDRMAREKDQQRAERAAPVPPPASRPPAPSAMRIAPSAQVLGQLTVKDRHAADRELAELLSRVGGTETARRAEADGDTVGLVIPRAAYPEFAQGLARIGSWRPESEPPDLPERVPVTLRITQ